MLFHIIAIIRADAGGYGICGITINTGLHNIYDLPGIIGCPDTSLRFYAVVSTIFRDGDI